MRPIIYNGLKYYTGYIPNPEAVDNFCNLLSKCGHEPDGGKIAQNIFTDDEKKDVLLSTYLIKAFQGWMAGRQAIGDCVSWACAHTIDTLMGIQAYLKQTAESTPYQVCSETQYGFMRVEVFGKPDFGGDGAYGSAAAKAVMQYGSLHRTKYDLGKGWDFTTYSGARAKEFGRTGVPDELEPMARSHIVGTTTLIKDFDTAAKFIINGYPIQNAHMKNPTAEGSRDKDGYATGKGFAHAMNYIGVRWGSRPALLKSNTGWANTVTGNMWPEDFNSSLASCSWWEEASICDKVLKGGDSFAYSQYNGFKQQKLPSYGTEEYL